MRFARLLKYLRVRCFGVSLRQFSMADASISTLWIKSENSGRDHVRGFSKCQVEV